MLGGKRMFQVQEERVSVELRLRVAGSRRGVQRPERTFEDRAGTKGQKEAGRSPAVH